MKDETIAKKYIAKAQSSRDRGIEFNLSFQAFKNLLSARKCYYTGVTLTRTKSGQRVRCTDFTIDRVDSTKGYIKGNCVAACSAANKLKNFFESDGVLDVRLAERIICKTKRRLR